MGALLGRKHRVKRRDPAGEYVDGWWAEGEESEIEILANVQPLTNLDLDSSDAGRRLSGSIKVYTGASLVVGVQDERTGDKILYNDFWYEIIDVSSHTGDILPHNHYMAEKREKLIE